MEKCTLSNIPLEEKRNLLKEMLRKNKGSEGAETYPLSSAQKRIYLVTQIDPFSVQYNITGIYRVDGKIDRERIDYALHMMVQRHMMLRASFHMDHGKIKQKINDDIKLSVTYCNEGGDNIENKIKRFVYPFDLTKAPLCRIEIITGKNGWLLFDMHHIISDGMSMMIFIREFTQYYNGQKPEPFKTNYTDYISWSSSAIAQKVIDYQRKYWENTLRGCAITKLPNDKNNKNVVGENAKRVIDGLLLERLDRYCKEHSITRFIFLLAILNLAIYLETGQKDVMVGTPIANRDKTEFENIIGIFLNVLVLRTILDPTQSFVQYLQRVQKTVVDGFNHRLYPFELVDELIRKEHKDRIDSTVSILYNYLPFDPEAKIASKDFILLPSPCNIIAPKYDLTLYASESLKELLLNIIFQNNKYEKYKIDRILDNMIKLTVLITQSNNIIVSTMTNSLRD